MISPKIYLCETNIMLVHGYKLKCIEDIGINFELKTLFG